MFCGRPARDGTRWVLTLERHLPLRLSRSQGAIASLQERAALTLIVENAGLAGPPHRLTRPP